MCTSTVLILLYGAHSTYIYTMKRAKISKTIKKKSCTSVSTNFKDKNFEMKLRFHWQQWWRNSRCISAAAQSAAVIALNLILQVWSILAYRCAAAAWTRKHMINSEMMTWIIYCRLYFSASFVWYRSHFIILSGWAHFALFHKSQIRPVVCYLNFFFSYYGQ